MTDLILNYNKALKLYNNRWTIEVIFKELKQYLNFGKCQSNDFDVQVAEALSITPKSLNRKKMIVKIRGENNIF
jgi:IS4 transposase